MLSVAVHKDVAEYTPKVLGQMTARTLGSIAGALGASVLTGVIFVFLLGISFESIMVLIYTVSLPFWCVGFWRPKKMPFERFAPLFLAHILSTNRLIHSTSPGRLFAREAVRTKRDRKKHADEQYRKLSQRRGIEAWEPSRQDG
jgi:hypothetical protein